MSNAAHPRRKWLEQDEIGAKRGRFSHRAEVARHIDDDSTACTQGGKQCGRATPDD